MGASEMNIEKLKKKAILWYDANSPEGFGKNQGKAKRSLTKKQFDFWFKPRIEEQEK